MIEAMESSLLHAGETTGPICRVPASTLTTLATLITKHSPLDASPMTPEAHSKSSLRSSFGRFARNHQQGVWALSPLLGHRAPQCLAGAEKRVMNPIAQKQVPEVSAGLDNFEPNDSMHYRTITTHAPPLLKA